LEGGEDLATVVAFVADDVAEQGRGMRLEALDFVLLERAFE
jgi:hypothetical protein